VLTKIGRKQPDCRVSWRAAAAAGAYCS